MPATDAQVAALRAFLAPEAGTTHLTALLGDDGIPGYQRLADAALSIAAVRRFAPKYTSADVARYVATVRLRRLQDGSEYDIDPGAAENVLRYALGQHIPGTPDPGDRFRAVIALLETLADSEVSSEADLDSLLADARRLADRWLGMPGPVK